MANQSGKKRKKKSYEQKPVKTPADMLLLKAIVRVVARRGVENASTRAIAAEAGNGITDTVIYRFFSGKDDLMRQAFFRESTALRQEVEGRFVALWETNLPREQRMRYLWHGVWAWLTGHKDECTFMIRYYYSASFDEAAQKGYYEIWLPLAERLVELLPDTEVKQLVFIILETTAAACYPVCAGQVPDSASASEYGFRRVMGLVNEFLSKQALLK